MKKILFLLLFTVVSYGQVSTGQEQEFDYGIKNNAAPTVISPNYITTQGSTGVYGKIEPINLPISNPVKDSLQKKLNLPTGFLQGLQLSINADPTKYNIAAGYYTVTDFTDLANPFVKIINYAGATGLTPAYLNTANSTYVALDINGAVVYSASPFTNAQRRTLAIIGNVVHSNLTTINVTNEIKAPIVAGTNQLHDFMRAVGFLNEEGNIYTANGANLQINKSAGRIFGMGVNSVDYLNPHELSLPAQTALTFAYRLRTGTQYANTTSIDPNNWDNNGVLTAVSAGNKWTIQHFNIFQSGLTRAQPGQTVYNSYAEALAALPTDPFVTEQNIADNAVFRAYLIIKQGTTDLQAAITAGTALFVPVDKFGNVVGNGAIALTYSNIVAALGYTPENVANKQNSLAVDGTGVKYPTVDAVNLKNIEIIKRSVNHSFVKESKIRTLNSEYVYTGSVLTVGSGGTYATITAAFNAAVSGDILQLADGVYNIASEAGGYLLINSTTKRVLIRGNAANNTAVIIRQNSVATYCVRLRTANEVTFQNLTIESDQANAAITISMDTPSSPVTTVFNNCIVKNTSASAVNTINIIGIPVNNGKFEFRNCDIYQSNNVSSSVLAQSNVSDANSLLYYLPVLLDKCNIFGKIAIGGSVNINIYSSIFTHNQSDIVLAIGTDTNTPTNFTSHVDIRGCSFRYLPGFTNHGVLLGRGTKDVYFINNYINLIAGNNPLSLGVVVKSIAANIDDVIIEGNYIEAPRPLYVKGAQYCSIRNNTALSNWNDLTNGYGFEINNPLNGDGEISSLGNIVENNNFIGKTGAIGLTYSGTTTAFASFQLCTFKSNKYLIPTGSLYLNVPSTTWESKYLTTKQDTNSILYYF